MTEAKGNKAIKQEKSTLPKVRVGISIGDINGIGPEVVIKALGDNRMLINCTPIVYGSSKVLSFYNKQLRVRDFNYQTIKSADEAKNKKISVINSWNDDVKIEPGQTNETGGNCAFKALEAATQDLASGKIDVLVTAPISKDAMGKVGFNFPGHTEYLADLAGEDDALMIMATGSLRVALVTTHIPIKDVSSSLSIDRVHSKISEFAASLRRDFGIIRPKIAVLGLNPHAGENGKMGEEESESISPAINKAKGEGILAFGPYPADGFFGSGARANYDGVLAMYHDQGLTAFKALAFDEGVNVTAGLPIVRTSPDHGTAFDIAGQNKASEASMRQAIYQAIDIHRNRNFEKEITANPLEAQPKGSSKKKKEESE